MSEQMNTTPLTGGDQSAFPVPYIPMHTCGMTLRDWFAGQALAGVLAIYSHPQSLGLPKADGEIAALAGDVYGLADAMIAEREAKP